MQENKDNEQKKRMLAKFHALWLGWDYSFMEAVGTLYAARQDPIKITDAIVEARLDDLLSVSKRARKRLNALQHDTALQGLPISSGGIHTPAPEKSRGNRKRDALGQQNV